ncbi:MAG: hypothetical protein PHI86_06405 [Candidatus Omnitrophica bacterium]|nr:hypothetical protein [Candidatus Omnitrophota bacterium]
MSKKAFYLIFICMFLVGCTTFGSEKYTDTVYPATSPENVKVFYEQPPVEFVKIGEVIADTGNTSIHSHVIDRLKDMAAQMGADAIILREEEKLEGFHEYGNTEKHASGESYRTTTTAQYTTRLFGVAIKYIKK